MAGVQSESPAAEYNRRLRAIADSTVGYRRRDNLLAVTKLVLGLLIVLAAIWLVKYHAAKIFFLLIPVLLFVVLAVLHERVLRRLRDCSRGCAPTTSKASAASRIVGQAQEKPASAFSTPHIPTRATLISSARPVSFNFSAPPARAPARKLWPRGCSPQLPSRKWRRASRLFRS